MQIKQEIIISIEEYFEDSLKRKRESGGIIGSEGGVITRVIFDEGKSCEHPCVYSPNTQFLNSMISEWQNEGVSFAGIFHTHFGGAEVLSCDDMKYIHLIMSSMPSEIKELYFPVLCIPELKINAFKAICEKSKIKIVKEGIKIL